jgi:hypothetical protein
MSRKITVSFDRLVMYHSEIGVHRGREYGFRTVFGFRSLHDVPFLKLANKVKDAYEGRHVPSHEGWPAQHEAMKWFVDLGKEGVLALKGEVKIRTASYDRYYLVGGNHRSLALYILGDTEVRAKLER